MEQVHAAQSEWLPPVEKLHSGGEYAVVGIELDSARLAEFGGVGVGDPTFTNL